MDSPKVTAKELLDENRRLRQYHENVEAGLRQTLRDEFAKAALPGVLMARAQFATDMKQESIAEECWELADAMLAARAKGGDA